jgi:hypothetical protein
MLYYVWDHLQQVQEKLVDKKGLKLVEWKVDKTINSMQTIFSQTIFPLIFHLFSNNHFPNIFTWLKSRCASRNRKIKIDFWLKLWIFWPTKNSDPGRNVKSQGLVRSWTEPRKTSNGHNSLNIARIDLKPSFSERQWPGLGWWGKIRAKKLKARPRIGDYYPFAARRNSKIQGFLTDPSFLPLIRNLVHGLRLIAYNFRKGPDNNTLSKRFFCDQQSTRSARLSDTCKVRLSTPYLDHYTI